MALDFGAINWLAVIVGAAIYFVLGALWYSPVLFGRQWQAAIGWDPERRPPQMNPVSYAIPAAIYLVVAIATALIGAATGVDSLMEGLVLGLVTGLGYAGPMLGIEAVF